MSDNRTHLEEKYTWDLTTIFATDADWETEYESTVQDLKKASAYAFNTFFKVFSLLGVSRPFRNSLFIISSLLKLVNNLPPFLFYFLPLIVKSSVTKLFL